MKSVRTIFGSMVATALGLALAAAGCGSTGGSSPVEERATRSVALYKQGVQEFNEGKIDDAIGSLKKANELQPGYTLLRYDLARMLLHRALVNDNESLHASAEARRLRADGKEDEARKQDQEAQARYRRAVLDFREARDLLVWVADRWANQEPNVYFLLSKAYTGLGEFKDARKHLDTFIEVGNPRGPEREQLLRARERLREAELQQERLGGG